MEGLENRWLLTTTVFSDDFESGAPLDSGTWPLNGDTMALAVVRQEGTTNGPLNASGSYAVTIHGISRPEYQGGPVTSRGMQSRNNNL